MSCANTVRPRFTPHLPRRNSDLELYGTVLSNVRKIFKSKKSKLVPKLLIQKLLLVFKKV